MEPELLQQGLWRQFEAEGWTVPVPPERCQRRDGTVTTLARTHQDIAFFVRHIGCLCRAGHYVKMVNCLREADGAYALFVHLGFCAPRAK